MPLHAVAPKQYKILDIDPLLKPYRADIDLRMERYAAACKRLCGAGTSLSAAANAHLFFGFHRTDEGWLYREWAPAAEEMWLTGDFNGWHTTSHPLTAVGDGVWEIRLPGADALPHGSKIKVLIQSGGQLCERIPLYCKRVVQNPGTHSFDGQIWQPETPFVWTDANFRTLGGGHAEPFIYECHIGMAGEAEEVSTFAHFTAHILPRIHRLGYNTIQLMAIMEHPYYGSFGYQVSNFFAVSSWFGTPEDLKKLVDTAHALGIAVLLDVVHSHAAANAAEGIAAFDGTEYQFFHKGDKGNHPAWGTKLFDYGKDTVVHFLLSNLKFWLMEYHFDGFRFDGVTSMLYHNHGLGEAFAGYAHYFSLNTDTEAITYLQLAAALCREVKPDCILIAEDMSGMPGMCLPVASGGIGFDYRLSMGVPDFWIRTLRDKRDEDWDLGQLWYELVQRRPQEKVIGYCESHDQALVGDKTIIFWLADQDMYWHMDNASVSDRIDRAIALHKMIRLITCACAGDGYLNFMGNEFGHPEWVDFPREGNNWSFRHARRQWSLADNGYLRYRSLQEFDRAMIAFIKDNHLLAQQTTLLRHDQDGKFLAFTKGDALFLFNFHPTQDYTATLPITHAVPTRNAIPSAPAAPYRVAFSSQDSAFGGFRTAQTPWHPDEIGKDSLRVTLARREAVLLFRGK